MDKPVAEQITAEIKKVDKALLVQKKAIKANLGNPRAIEAATSELKALNTRQERLVGNLKKVTLDLA